MFCTVRFLGVKDHLETLEHLDVARIASFVKAISFEDPTHGSIQDKGLLLSERLRAAWIGLLRPLPVLEKAYIFSYDFEGSQALSDRTGTETPARMGDALIAAALTCLSSAGTRVRRLKVACSLTGFLDWQSLQGWEELDLSRLENVTYDPEPDTSVLPNEEYDARQAAVAAKNLFALFEKCQGSLRKIKIRGYCEVIWPGEQTLNLPALRHLNLSFDGIHVRNLGSWLRHMPRLEYFRLAGCYVTDGDLTNWLCVFDAIRDHPRNRSGIRIVFEQAVHNDGAEISLDYTTNQYEETLEWYEDVQRGKVESDPWCDAYQYIKLYMVGEVGYNYSIRTWLQDEDDDEDEDQDDDDDEDDNDDEDEDD